ncbi:MAG TPA: hypothetical protein VFQ77_11540 [Pseudonocardiaceae bacterium]|nr:hypothetical protein [Pseudonocardiaceae bacterium]
MAGARPGNAADTAWALLDDAYELAQVVCLRFGYYDLGALAARCGRDAATKAGDPVRAAVAAFRYTGARLRRGDHAGVLRALDRAHGLIESEHSPTADAVRTVVHLRQARVQARLGARDRADEHVGEARRLLVSGIPTRPYYSVNATPANIEMHHVEVPVELADGTTAVSRAEQVQFLPDTHATIAGHHWVNVARAWTLHGDRAKALAALQEARRIAPQQTRYHPSVHETVHLLAEHGRRATDSLAGFARWAGITLEARCPHRDGVPTERGAL